MLATSELHWGPSARELWHSLGARVFALPWKCRQGCVWLARSTVVRYEMVHVGFVRPAFVGHGHIFAAWNSDFRFRVFLDEPTFSVFTEKGNRRRSEHGACYSDGFGNSWTCHRHCRCDPRINRNSMAGKLSGLLASLGPYPDVATAGAHSHFSESSLLLQLRA